MVVVVLYPFLQVCVFGALLAESCLGAFGWVVALYIWWIPLPLSFCYIGGYLLVDGLVGFDCCVIWDLDLDLDLGQFSGLDIGCM